MSFRRPVPKPDLRRTIVTDITVRIRSLSGTLCERNSMQPPSTDEGNLSLPQACVARQPIFERDQKIVGYELLFRQPGDNKAIFSDPEQATAQVIFSSFFEIGLERMVGSCLAFINTAKGFLLEDHCRLLPRKRVVYEIQDDAESESGFLKRIRTLSEEGFQLALDNFAFQPQQMELIPFCAYIKIDMRKANRPRLKEEVESLKKHSALLVGVRISKFSRNTNSASSWDSTAFKATSCASRIWFLYPSCRWIPSP